jgi:hypothetical protein
MRVFELARARIVVPEEYIGTICDILAQCQGVDVGWTKDYRSNYIANIAPLAFEIKYVLDAAPEENTDASTEE